MKFTSLTTDEKLGHKNFDVDLLPIRSTLHPFGRPQTWVSNSPVTKHLVAKGSVVSVCILLVVQNHDIVLKPNDKHTNLNQASNVRLRSGNCETIRQPNKRRRRKTFDTLTSPFYQALSFSGWNDNRPPKRPDLNPCVLLLVCVALELGAWLVKAIKMFIRDLIESNT